MEFMTKPTVTRFDELEPGEIFIFSHEAGLCAALAVFDPTNGSAKWILPLGPPFPNRMTCPTLKAGSGELVISFRKDYILRLPSSAQGWLTQEPSHETTCFMVTQQGVYLRANFDPFRTTFRPCYIDIESAKICADQNGYTRPNGICAFAVQWDILTAEKKTSRNCLASTTSN
jgi:hypothetical protein